MAGDLIYTTIIHAVRKELGLSLIEYCLVDMVDKMSNKPAYPYCRKTQTELANDLNVSRRTLVSAMQKMVKQGLIEKHGHGCRSAEKWHQALHVSNQKSAKIAQFQNDGKVTNLHNKSAKIAQFSETHNNVLKTKEIKSVPNGTDGEAPQTSYGNSEINWVLDEYKAIVGRKSAGPKDRFCARHLLRVYSREQISQMLKFCTTFEYAPVIASVSDLWLKKDKIRAAVDRVNLRLSNQAKREQESRDFVARKQALMNGMTP